MKRGSLKFLKFLLIFVIFIMFISSTYSLTNYSYDTNNQSVAVPQPGEKTLNYYRSGNLLWIFENLLSFIMLAAILFGGFSAKIRDFSKKLCNGKWFFTIAIYFLIFSLIDFLLFLPLEFYQGFVREHAYGLSDQMLTKWFQDAFISLFLNFVIGALILCVLYLLIKKSPRRWWLYAAILFIPLLIFMLLIEPIYISPLYNDFGPMHNKTLETKIISLAEKAGVDSSRVYEVNKSVDTKTINAYVTGFLSSKRIVICDTTIAMLNEKEILFIVGHEIGHYVLGHVIQNIVISSLTMLISLFLINLIAQKIIKRFKKRFGFNEISDIASLPLILIIINICLLIFAPFTNVYSRHIEHEADIFGIEITKDNYPCATAFAKLVNDKDLINPWPGLLYKLWRSGHPSLGERIDFCNSYKPWEEKKPLKYDYLFKEK